MDLVLTSLQKSSPVHVALLFLPEFGAAVVTAALFGVTAFLVAPILLYLATAIGAGAASGLHAAIWICLCPAAAGGAGAVAPYTLGGGRLPTPDLAAWTSGEPAWESPPLLARLRRPAAPAPDRAADRVRSPQRQR